MAAAPRTQDNDKAEGQYRRGLNTPEGNTTPQPTEPGTPLGARNPRGHGTKAQAPRKGNPADSRLTYEPEGHTKTPATQTKRAAPQLAEPPGHQPTTSPRPAFDPTNSTSPTSADATPCQHGGTMGPPHTMAQRNAT